MKCSISTKSLFAFFSLCFFCNCLSEQKDKNLIVLASKGRAEAVIVIPPKAPPPVAFAGEEIKYYLDKMTKGNFKIVHEPPPETPAIILGEEFALEAGIKPEKIKRDGYAIKTIGNKIYIAGKDDDTEKSKILFMLKDKSRQEIEQKPDERFLFFGMPSWDFERGTLYGAYDFLERLGVRWFFPGDMGEIVNEKQNLTIPPISIIEEPFFDLRVDGNIIFPTSASIKKHKINLDEYGELGWNAQNQKLWLIRNRESSKWMAFNHRPIRQQWPQRFGNSHPQYFALLKNGERALTARQCYLNYTSEEMLTETLKDMDAFFSGKNPEARGIKSNEKFKYSNGWEPNVAYGNTFSLLPNDGLKVDQSPESQKFIREDKPLYFRHTNYIWQFINKAAKELKKNHPEKFITCIAYQSYCEVPDPDVVAKLPDNVIVGMAALSGASRINTFMRDKERERFIELLDRWTKISNTPFLFWDYWLWRHKQADRNGVPMFLPRKVQDFVKTRAKYGKYIHMEHDNDNLTFEHLNRYMMFRLLWNPNTDVDVIFKDYCDKFYGSASEIIHSMFTDIEEKCFQIAKNNADMIAIWEQYFDSKTMEKYRFCITEAEKLVRETNYQKNVAIISKWFITPMEDARGSYVKNIKDLVSKGKNILISSKTPQQSMKIDGKISERPWMTIGGTPLFNNINGKYNRNEKATIRIRHSLQSLFFIFEINEADAKKIAKEAQDYVEIFLDANNDRETYYWLMLSMDGKRTTSFYPGPGEPPNDWNNEMKTAVELTDTGWTAEVEIPFKSIGLEEKNLKNQEIGVLCCLTRKKHIKTKDVEAFTTSNPVLRGAFHQPGMFNRLHFVSPQKVKEEKTKGLTNE
ncbi:MAG: hypothetical protein A2017_20505 [Lentisphaerae bacterium GWF2_44_16]|nr:MAG: hypothetical protein A2017_20505 [Lentisphaerae bacterium GWF2_44_16]